MWGPGRVQGGVSRWGEEVSGGQGGSRVRTGRGGTQGPGRVQAVRCVGTRVDQGCGQQGREGMGWGNP